VSDDEEVKDNIDDLMDIMQRPRRTSMPKRIKSGHMDPCEVLLHYYERKWRGDGRAFQGPTETVKVKITTLPSRQSRHALDQLLFTEAKRLKILCHPLFWVGYTFLDEKTGEWKNVIFGNPVSR